MTGRDDFASDYSKEVLENRIFEFYSSNNSALELKNRYNINDYRRFIIQEFKDKYSYNENNLHKSLFRPFDERFIYYQQYLVQEWQFRVMKHMLKENEALII